jgi:curved DNA-binding protein
MAMDNDQSFIDYYQILQVSPICDAKVLGSAYHYLAKMYHPDHADSADAEKFTQVIEAYKVLRNPKRRAKYDLLYSKNLGYEFKVSQMDGGTIQDESALDDADDHAKILMFLYKKRREDAKNAGVVGFYLQQMLNCSDEHFEFHKWYLKEKGFIVLTEHGTLAITIQGVDHVISLSRTAKAEKLLLSMESGSSDDEQAADGKDV